MWIPLLLCLYCVTFAVALPEIGHWEVDKPLVLRYIQTSLMRPGKNAVFPKSVLDGTAFSVQVTCTKVADVRFSLSVLWSECADAFAYVKQGRNASVISMLVAPGLKTENIARTEKQFTCSPVDPTTVDMAVPRSGSQMTVVLMNCIDSSSCDKDINAHYIVDIKGSYGYLSGIEYPLRTFYGVLALGHALLAFLWLCFTLFHWKDLLRIQYYITLMVIIGLVEQITLYALYESLNRTGVTLKSALVFALIVSCVKRTLARFLLLIVCVGYGITKSRLGTAYRRIVWICVIYLVCCLLDSGMRAFHPRFKPSLAVLLGGLPMIAVDLAILWWSFSYLVSTLRETRMRRNKVKYRLYRIFSALLIAVALVSILCMCASIFLLHWRPCTRAWRYIWFDETFWQLLFFVILLTIVILWRPSSTNKLYARSAFLDPDVEPPPEDLEERLLDAIVSGINDESEGGKKGDTNVALEDDALRWAEENIPSSQPSRNGANRQSGQGGHSAATTAAAATQLKLD
uniref:Transmembrane protein 87A n=1 Tax=Echinococcus canadensis TaxID=519352 RepID=A0A915F0C4_9CEST